MVNSAGGIGLWSRNHGDTIFMEWKRSAPFRSEVARTPLVPTSNRSVLWGRLWQRRTQIASSFVVALSCVAQGSPSQRHGSQSHISGPPIPAKVECLEQLH